MNIPSLEKKLERFLVAFTAIACLTGSAYASGTDLSDLPQEIKAITVGLEGVTVSFEKAPQVQVVFRREQDESVIPLGREPEYVIRPGQNLGWGDGDHVFAALILNKLEGEDAYLTLIREHRPPASHAYLARKDQSEYVIKEAYVNDR